MAERRFFSGRKALRGEAQCDGISDELSGRSCDVRSGESPVESSGQALVAVLEPVQRLLGFL